MDEKMATKENNIPPPSSSKISFLWVGAMIALYISAVSLLSLLFTYLNYLFPDALLSPYATDPYLSGVSYQMASLIVFFPLFVFLMRFVHKGMTHDPFYGTARVRYRMLYFTLFVAGATIAGDLVVLLMHFFNGDITVRFGLKVLTVFAVAGLGFLYFFAELRRYWQVHSRRSRVLGWGSLATVALIVGVGFLIIGTPWQMRLYRYDAQKVSDLRNISQQITYYWNSSHSLPATLSELSAKSPYPIPRDPQTDNSYSYRPTGSHTFELCADFNAPTPRSGRTPIPPPPVPVSGGVYEGGGVSWVHGAGKVCFSRTVLKANGSL